MTLALTDLELAAVRSVWVAGEREIVAAFGGTSMLPSIAPGERLMVHCGRVPNVGEVVAYLAADKVVVHRLAAGSDDGTWLLTWGDANAIPDIPFPRSKLIGTVLTVERNVVNIGIPPLNRRLRQRLILRFLAATSSYLWVERRWRLLYLFSRFLTRRRVLDSPVISP